MSRSRWEQVGREGNIVFIRDLDLGGRSVTNDAEAVYTECQVTLGPCRVVYQDSQGDWAEIVALTGGTKTWMGTSISFKPWYGEVWDKLTKV